MPDIPQVPGVPALASYGGSIGPLIIADALVAISTFLRPGWGIYVDGFPVITPATFFTQQINSTLGAISQVASLIGLPNVVPSFASTAEFDYSADSPISNYPQEEGAFQSYDKVQLPFDIRLKLTSGGSASQRQAFLDTLEALRTSTRLVDILTPEKVYPNCNCKHVDFSRRGHSGVELITADVGFQQVRVVSASLFSNTLSPTTAAPAASGNVQPQATSSVIDKSFAGLGGSPY